MQHSPAGPRLLPPKHCSGSLGTGCEEQPECFSQCHWHLCTQGQGKEQWDQQGAPGQQCPAEGCRMEHSHLHCQKQRSCPLLRCPVDPKHTALSPTNTAVTCPGLLFDFSTAFPSTTSLCENCNKKASAEVSSVFISGQPNLTETQMSWAGACGESTRWCNTEEIIFIPQILH